MRGRRAAETGAEQDGDPVAVLRAAIAAAVGILGRLSDQLPSAGGVAPQVLTTVTETIGPVRSELVAAARSDPYGPVAATLTFLHNATEHLATGDVEAFRAALVTAHVTLARLEGIGEPNHDRDRVVAWNWRC